MRSCEISVIVTAHREGRLAHHTLQSIFRSAAYAKTIGIRTEVIVVLDNPDALTELYFSRYTGTELLSDVISVGDPGLARNHGVKLASGKFVAFLDADDLMGETWLANAYSAAADNSEEKVVFYPEFVVFFDNKHLIFKAKGSGDRDFRATDLIEYNCWNSVHFLASRQLLLSHPFEATPTGSGFGYEDWHWYCDSMAMGCQVKIVDGTNIFYRSKASGSRLSAHNECSVVCPSSKLFEPHLFSSLMDNNNEQTATTHLCDEAHKAKFLSTLARRILKIVDRFYARLDPIVITPLYRLFPKLRRMASVVVAIGQGNALSAAMLPKWLIQDWKAINVLEPKIFPDSWLLASIQFHVIPESVIAKPYRELCQMCNDNIEYIFLIPWLKRGGSDLVTINYINAVAKHVSPGSIAIITDLNSDSPWAKRLPEGVQFIEFGQKYAVLSDEKKENLLVRFLLQKNPRVIHNINSSIGYKIFTKYGKALSSISNLYVTTFCPEPTEEGKLYGYPFIYLPDCYDNLKALFCENQTFLDQLSQTYAFGSNLYVHYTPVNLPDKKPHFSRPMGKGHMNILWAGRLDRQKRPDLLLEIARRCVDYPFTFHVYGESLISADIYSAELSALNNVRMYGSFDGFSSLPLDDYDLLLYTSQWDGLPTVLLDAVAHGLPVIAPKVGGIPELIFHEVTGFLIDPFDSVDMYVDCLRRVFTDPGILPDIREKAYRLVAERHSFESFNDALLQCPDYISR